ncbi:MAG TPA: class I SAM-dependent methyltransferase [Stellaceae bacterium]
MSQNFYDDPGFFEAYSRLPRSIAGLAGAPEWPALKALLPEMRGLKVIDLGCGYGWFCRWARESGATRVLGIDVSEKMLARARSDTADTAILYVRTDMESLALREASFDLAYSSLALHYVVNLEGLLATLKGALVAGGQLVFSVEHPIFTAPSRPGWSIDADRGKTWPLDNYLIEGPRRTNWLTEGVVKQHRTLTTYLNMLLRRGFVLWHIAEWGPSDAQVAAQPALADERQRPPFLIVAART